MLGKKSLMTTIRFWRLKFESENLFEINMIPNDFRKKESMKEPVMQKNISRFYYICHMFQINFIIEFSNTKLSHFIRKLIIIIIIITFNNASSHAYR